MAYYVDTSAMVKLVVAEPESAALGAWIAEADPDLVASDLSRTELFRAVRRTNVEHAVQARAVLESMTLLTVTAALFDIAGHLDPSVLRSLDAIRLASALHIGDDLEGLITYDELMADAARAHGIGIVAPS